MSYGKRWRNLNPYDLHKTLINEYLLTKKGNNSLRQRDTSKDKRDIDVIRENHQFLWNDDETATCQSWEQKLAKKYYDKLFKEYCIGDLSRYKENKIGLRWRTQQELIDGKGQFSCGSKRCAEKNNLKTWEVNFGYVEQGIKKNALVKLRLCPDCSRKLNYHHKRKEVKRLKCTPIKSKQYSNASDANDDPTNLDTNKEKSETSKSNNADSSLTSSESDIWKQNMEEMEQEKPIEKEFDEYLNELFL